MSDGLQGIVVHPAASLLPLLEGDEFEELVADIQEHGQRFPVVFHDGQLLDGRNRVRACVRLGIKPKQVDWNGGGSPVAYVVSANLRRRHLTPSQRAMVGADTLPMFKAEAKEHQKKGGGSGPSGRAKMPKPTESRKEAATAVNVSPRYVSTAARVKAERPDLAEKVRSGEITLPAAAKIVRGPSPDEIATKNPVVRWVAIVQKLAVAVGSLVTESGGVKPFLKTWSKGDRTHFSAQLDHLIQALQQIRKEL